MAKVVMMPRVGTAVASRSMEGKRCAYRFEEGTVIFDCQGCDGADDPPAEKCMAMFREALEAHPETVDILLRGSQDVWLKEKSVDSLRSLIAAKKAWDEFCGTIRSLPCHHKLSSERTSRYLDNCREGKMELFCKGDGPNCQKCLRTQEMALDSLRSDRRRARRTVAADRFRIVEVPGDGSR